MNREQQSPEDREFNLPDSLARIEQQLKQQQPQPVALDADAILRAALDDDYAAGTSTNQVDRRDRTANENRGLWLALGASWIGGALAGSLLTGFVMSRTADSAMAVNSIRAPSRIEKPVTEINTGSKAEADGSSEETRQDDDGDNVPRWSQSEFLVSNRILNLGRTAPGMPLLQAGSYVRLSATEGTWPVSGTSIDRSDTTSGDASLEGDTADGSAFDVDAPLTSKIKRDDLLRELLRDRPGSTL